MERVQGILHKYKPFIALDSEDSIFMLALFENHPECEAKIGIGIKNVFIQPNELYRQMEFGCVRLDGSRVVISYRKCLTPKPHKREVLSAMRAAVFPQILSFKSNFFFNEKTRTCEVTGVPISYSDCHIDHQAPYTFDQIVTTWMQRKGINFEQIRVRTSMDGTPTVIVDTELESEWQAYHEQNANLRAVSIKANLSILKKDPYHCFA